LLFTTLLMIVPEKTPLGKVTKSYRNQAPQVPINLHQ
jgi:hypothetical protein